MTLTFPLAADDFFDLVGVKAIAFNLSENQALSGLGGGELRATQLAPARWLAEIECALMTSADMSARQALFSRLQGAVNAFCLYPPHRAYPVADPDGSTYGSATPTVSARTSDFVLAIAGLPAGYVLTAGDFIQITYDTSREYLGQFVAGATADGAGDVAAIEVSVPLPAAVAADDAVNLIKPSGLFRLVPDSVHFASADSLNQTLSFSARQTHEAAS
ncbi:MAG: hypothetical protein H6873_05655 [Hyphomicrobiaceae bacterium]|nr:hypothetical protein [Hyphomicrobiaceae bacterium]